MSGISHFISCSLVYAKKIIFCLTACLFILFDQNLYSQQSQDLPIENTLMDQLNKFSLSAYGAMNYYNFDWQTDSLKRNSIDHERFILELGYTWTPKIKLNTEIEFEHGGTGAELEFDRFEEFGEFEFDISKGGEVLIEQMNLELQLLPSLSLKIGRLKVPFSSMFSKSEPTDYFTATNSEMETQILPENWTENGLSLKWTFGANKRWTSYLALVNGLDGSAFNSANWVKRGNQQRFEMVNAENFAIAFRLDRTLFQNSEIGFSSYLGNTTGNRPKPDLKVRTLLFLSEFHLALKLKSLSLRSQFMYGSLENSEALSNFNRNLSNALNVKRTPVGASMIGGFMELGAHVFGPQGIMKNSLKNQLTLYGRYDFYDTMNSTEGLIFNNPRWERSSWTFGIVYALIPEVQIKSQYTIRQVGAPAPTSINGGTLEKTFVAGFAFEF